MSVLRGSTVSVVSVASVDVTMCSGLDDMATLLLSSGGTTGLGPEDDVTTCSGWDGASIVYVTCVVSVAMGSDEGAPWSGVVAIADITMCNVSGAVVSAGVGTGGVSVTMGSGCLSLCADSAVRTV